MVKKTLTIVTLVALSIVSVATFAWGKQGQGRWMWQGQGAWQGQRVNAQTQCADTNNNGVCDGQEDWDNDGVINSQDPDFQKQYVNQADRMQDANNNGIPDWQEDFDWDGIPNNQDEDYKTYQNAPENGQLQSNQYKWANKGWVNAQGVNAPGNGTNSIGSNARGNRKNVQALAQKKQQYALKLGNLASQIDTVLDSFFTKLSALSVEDQITKLQTILYRVNVAEERIQTITDEAKKELLENAIGYLKVAIEEKLAELQGTTTTTDDATSIIDSALGE